MKYIGIVACDEEYGIGKDGKVPWREPCDLKHFAKVTTTGSKPAVLMGRKTFQSIGRALPNRINIVISSSVIPNCDYCTNNINNAINWAIKQKVSHLYIIGGASIYGHFVNMYDEFYCTYIKGKYECDINIKDTIQLLYQKYEYNECLVDGNCDLICIQFIDYDIDNNENNFKCLLKSILKAPLIENRTQYKAYTMANQFIKFSLLNNTLPASNLRSQWIKGIFHELQWFIRGDTNLKSLHDNNVHIWDANAMDWYRNKYNKEYIGDISQLDVGNIYGYQWRKFGESSFDQLKYIINELKNNPHSRRIMLSGWYPPMIFDNACLPPCHVSYGFNVIQGKLYCMVLQRSSDVALALYWNIISGSILTHMLAKVCGYEAAEIAFSIQNAHIYENHVECVKTMLKRECRQFPKIYINEVKDIEEYIWEDIQIVGYDPHPKISVGDMAV